MVDEGGRPAAGWGCRFPRPRRIVGQLWYGSHLPEPIRQRRGEGAGGPARASLPFGTVVAVQATFASYLMFTSISSPSNGSSPAGRSTTPLKRKQAEQESHMAHTLSLTTIKIRSPPLPEVAHGNDALTAQAEDWLNSL
ncbi:hypothetical protein DFS34DRAFT_649164 [Phlyctochytrium arcticum]|nr:hypothetical protein DFS34DRAFT_649164 [Phlyctochytrium arcticum]